MNCSLFGGSNSVLINGLQKALRENFVVENYALGATSCIQNTLELVRNFNKILKTDFVVTESNVNDIMSYTSLKIPRDKIESQIDDYYKLLNTINKPIFVLILPTHRKQESLDDICFINNIHVENCLKYGFFYIDIQSKIDNLNLDNLNLLMPHPRHINEAFIYHLMLNICNFIKNNNGFCFKKIIRDSVKDKYKYFSAEDFDISPNLENKKNSAFSVNLSIIDNKFYKFPKIFIGWQLLAINTWCDDYASVIISSKNMDYFVVKSFGKLYSSSEFISSIEISEDTVVTLNVDNIISTEPTILVKYNEKGNQSDLKIEGFLLVNNKVEDVVNNYVYDIIDLNITEQIWVNWEPYIAAMKTFLSLSVNNRSLV
ncbi:hypothetical protein LVY74_12035 [Acinetobacter sp. ME22]|uniref:hypothetical protein n=1 Tax=Acinetobacter sp. ME22 TaxID=2904802 RepID=UPI001EDBC65A|nr:hypothetical protein [Acinetobacter sp. ME22]MCG2574279.1 hypothetical protein [Acinetobacter sp. ME22]